MSQNSVMQHLKTELIQVLVETFERSNGIYLYQGTSLFETLEGVSAEQASRPVCSEGTTLAAQVKHTAFYLGVLEEYVVANKTDSVDWEEIWFRVKAVTSEEWEVIRCELKTAYQHLLATIKAIENWDENEVSGIVAIASHSAYHLGVIRQALHTILSS